MENGKVIEHKIDNTEWCELELTELDIPLDCYDGYIKVEYLYQSNVSECLKEY